MRDLLNSIHLVRALSPSAGPSDNTVQVSEVIDLQGFDSLTFLIATGALADADATFATVVEHGDQSNLSDAAAVDEDGLIGTAALASFEFDDDNKVFKVGYRGGKRYVRVKITPANNTGAAPLCVIALLGHPSQSPTANPPA